MKKINYILLAVLFTVSLTVPQSVSAVNLDAPTECSGMTFDKTIVGTTASETLKGTNGRDLIFGMGGSDTIKSLEGNDCIVTSNASSDVNTGDGNDVGSNGR